MRRASIAPVRATIWAGAILALAACGDTSPTELAAPRPEFSSTTGAVLVECPADTTLSATATIDALGGTVEVDGTRIQIPARAVLLPTKITLTLPASNYMEVDIRANGAEHFTFETAVDVSISYARCTRSNIDKSALSVWYIDSATKELLENMGGVDDKTARTVTFSTDHLSGYSIAQ